MRARADQLGFSERWKFYVSPPGEISYYDTRAGERLPVEFTLDRTDDQRRP